MKAKLTAAKAQKAAKIIIEKEGLKEATLKTWFNSENMAVITIELTDFKFIYNSYFRANNFLALNRYDELVWYSISGINKYSSGRFEIDFELTTN